MRHIGNLTLGSSKLCQIIRGGAQALAMVQRPHLPCSQIGLPRYPDSYNHIMLERSSYTTTVPRPIAGKVIPFGILSSDFTVKNNAFTPKRQFFHVLGEKTKAILYLNSVWYGGRFNTSSSTMIRVVVDQEVYISLHHWLTDAIHNLPASEVTDRRCLWFGRHCF